MHDDLHRLETEIITALAGLSAAQTQATLRAHPEKWSIQQIAEHLLLTYQVSIPAIQARLQKGSPTRAVPSLKQYLGQFFLISLGQFPSGRKAPAQVSPTLPSTVSNGEHLAVRIHGELVHLDRLITEGERLFGRVRAATHMILGPLSMQQWRRFHLIHGRHHVKQIWAIRRQDV